MKNPLLAKVVSLGQEMVRRKMSPHVQSLRKFYERVDAGNLKELRDQFGFTWTEGLVEDWMKLLRVPPFQDFYPVRKPGEKGCEVCRTHGPTFVKAIFPGGHLAGCRCPGNYWLEMDDAGGGGPFTSTQPPPGKR